MKPRAPATLTDLDRRLMRVEIALLFVLASTGAPALVGMAKAAYEHATERIEK